MRSHLESGEEAASDSTSAETSPGIRTRVAICSNGPSEQRIDVETGRIRRANASNISLVIDVQPVTGEGNGSISFRVSELSNAMEERLLVWSSVPRYSNQTAVLFLGENHAVIHTQKLEPAARPASFPMVC